MSGHFIPDLARDLQVKGILEKPASDGRVCLRMVRRKPRGIAGYKPRDTSKLLLAGPGTRKLEPLCVSCLGSVLSFLVVICSLPAPFPCEPCIKTSLIMHPCVCQLVIRLDLAAGDSGRCGIQQLVACNAQCRHAEE